MSIPSSFDVSGSSGSLGSFLSTNYDGSGLFSVLNSSSSGSGAATTEALSGAITTNEHNVITTLGGSTSPTSISWNANGTEPSVLTQMRNYGWIKLTKRTGGTSNTAAGYYQLTTLGNAIYARTSGGAVSSLGAASSDSSSSAASTGLTAAQEATLNSLLSSLGTSGSSTVDSLGSTSTSSTSGGVSTGSTGSLVNVLA